jgi:guanine deaminase
MLAIQGTNEQTTQSPPKRYSNKPLSIANLFHMATLGGASICNLHDHTGNFEVGKEFDALRVSPGRSPGFFHNVGERPVSTRSPTERLADLKQIFERFLFVSDDRDIADVWVRGRRVAGYDTK